jgi:hypothetical protein
MDCGCRSLSEHYKDIPAGPMMHSTLFYAGLLFHAAGMIWFHYFTAQDQPCHVFSTTLCNG